MKHLNRIGLLIVLVMSSPNITPQANALPVPASWDTSPVVTPYRFPSDQLVNTGMKRPLMPPVPHYQVGDTRYFFPLQQDVTTAFQLAYTSDHAYFWFPEEEPVDQAILQAVALLFDSQIWDLNRALYGEVDTAIHIINQSSISSTIMGAFQAKDQCPRSVCPQSNEANIIYLNPKVAPLGSPQYLRTLAHELQHLTQYHVDSNEQRWLDEGLSMLAEHLNGFEIEDMLTGQFLRIPDHRLHGWAFDGADMGKYYGASFLFTLYLYEQFGPDFIHALAQTDRDGLAAVQEVLRQQQPDFDLEEVFADWIVANYLDSRDGTPYGYATLDLPVQIEPKQLTTDYNDSVHQYGADYLLLSEPGSYRLRFDGADETDLFRSQPASDAWLWWSNRNCNSVTQLTAAADLAGLDTATLEFSAWWQIEDDVDWFQVLVSDDNGRSWLPVAGERARGHAPDAVGPHYSGSSVVWTTEAIDLSRYVGRSILIRFEYVTDGSLPETGVALKDVGIVEKEVFNAADFEANGFIYTRSAIHQTWSIILIQEGQREQYDVHPLTLDADNQVETSIVVTDDRLVTLVVAATAPFTFQRARYHVVVQPLE